MTNAHHTPGPWGITKHEDCEASIITAGHESIAFVYIDDNDKPATENNKADARLISAAPELLEALQSIIAEAIEHWPDAENWPAIEDAKTIIAKARGE